MCRLSCAPTSLLWPSPTSVQVSSSSATFSLQTLTTSVEAATEEIKALVESTVQWQLSHLKAEGDEATSGLPFFLTVTVEEDTLEVKGAVEDYSLTISSGERGEIVIEASTYFGARHALETLFQLVIWDSTSETFHIATDVEIIDSPYFPHRGVMLDTARNFIPVSRILDLINSMSYSKLNVFHWHITDSQSFPIQLPSIPTFTDYEAYSKDDIYKPADVQQIMEHALARGVEVVPELDAPAHVGAGWQAVNESLTVCVNKEPWTDWCVEPPCGQLNPADEALYGVLETIYGDWMGMMTPASFHLGGDEVHVGCWNSSPSILAWLEEQDRDRQEEDFMFLWDHFLQQSTAALARAASAINLTTPSMTLWNNQLTHPEHIHFLDPKKYTIQLWPDSTDMGDLTIKTVAEAGFKMIFSNYDATYLDCGFGAWVGNGNNWCSPYKQWQAQHQNDPLAILERQGVTNLEEAKANVLGGEVAMWTEQADGASIMTKIEPRASAYGERLWLGPATGGWVEAERRLVVHRERLARRGIQADSLTHGWCRQNEGKCILEQV